MDWHGKTVLITGGTGSFGRACVERLLRDDVGRVIVISSTENTQFDMRRTFTDSRIEYLIRNVRDSDGLRRAFESQPDIVIHAAAMKQVPACEYDPFEALKTNVLGAQNVIDAAIDCRIPKVVALSTDKAAAAVNAYGKSKALAESLFVRGNAYAGRRLTRFSVVRYGNVIGSRGSVVPLFQEHQRNGTAITITDRRMTRFWMLLADAVDLVLYAATEMQGGEIFVPEIPSASIVNVAARIAPDCETSETGLRPGEKLHETLITEDEAPQTVWRGTEGARVFVIQPVDPSWPYVPYGTPVGDGFTYRSDSPAALSRTLPLELAGVA